MNASPLRDDSLQRRLAEGLERRGLALSPEVQRRLLDYLALLQRWNRAYNLTAVRDPEAMVERHLLDSLSVLPYLDQAPAGAVADVGSGAGLPGIPLALARPQRPVTLIDSVNKKTRFQRQAIRELGLNGQVNALNARVEQLDDHHGRYPVVITRAFAPLARTCRLSGALLAPGGRLLAMKGPRVERELEELPEGWQARIHPLPTLESGGERCLVELRIETSASSERNPP